MTLEELAAAQPGPYALNVPEWALGAVQRRSITFATGLEDRDTFVVWVQAHSVTGDIRINPARPWLARDCDLGALDRATLVSLASVEGGIATTSWSEPLMSWDGWIGFQPYDKYPEPGLVRRVGDCMIEFAPSGIYVEDWRFKESRPGVLAGLRLVSEIDDKGNERAREGGLVVAGDHAIRVFARRHPLPGGVRAQDYVRESSDPAAALEEVFDCRVEYLERTRAGHVIRASTDPRREGLACDCLGPLSATPDGNFVTEKVLSEPGVVTRRWQIVSLEGGHVFPLATAAPEERLAWLDREADTLTDPVQSQTGVLSRCA